MFQLPQLLRRPGAWGLAAAFLAAAGSSAVAQTSRTYTTNADFEEGVLDNVNDTVVPDQLQINAATPGGVVPLINVSATGRGTMVRIDGNTGQILGEYRTAPQGLATNPSRTAIDSLGNVWVGNRDEAGNVRGQGLRGSVVKFGVCVGGTRTDALGNPDPTGGYLKPPFAYNTCVDRDGDGLIRTSMGLGDVLSWPNVTDGAGGPDGIVMDAQDEAILVFQRVHGLNVRHVSIAAGDNVWVGGYPLVSGDFDLLNGANGAILQTLTNPACGGHGGVTDPNGIVWSTTGEGGTTLMRFNPATNVVQCIDLTATSPNNTGENHGLNIGPDGTIWVTQFDLDQILRFNPDGSLVAGFPKPTLGDSRDRSCAVSPLDGHVWVDGSLGRHVSRLDANGNFLKSIDLGADGISPRGMAVDVNGKIWTTCLNSNTAKRIDPNGDVDNLGAVDLTVPLGAGAQPYNYSDMASAVTLPGTDGPGRWQVLYDSAVVGNEYGTISWTASVPAGTTLAVEFRASDDPVGISGLPFQPAQNGVPFSGVFGRYVDVRVTFTRPQGSTVTPVLFDLTIQGLPGGSDECPTGRRKPGSLLLFPEFDSRPSSTTLLTVTNTDGDFTPEGQLYAGTVQVEFVYIGRYGANGQSLPCLEVNRTHTLSPNDTLSVVARTHNASSQQGFVYVFAKDPVTGQAVVHNHLVGQALILNGFDGVEYSFNPYVFLGIGAEGTPTDHDGDGVRDLNGVEYGCAPDRLMVPRFLGQEVIPDLSAGFQGQLVLVNLTGGTGFTALVDFLIYNDNEEVFSAQTSFDCWMKRPLTEINGAFRQQFLANTNQDPTEILGGPSLESGWFRLNGALASSSAASIVDPAIVGMLVERIPGGRAACDLPYETGVQANGDLLLLGVLGDATP